VTARCPLCGGPARRNALTQDLDLSVLTKTERRILDEIIRHPYLGATIEQMLEAAYHDDPNGGPGAGNRTLDVHIHHLRRKLTAQGYGLSRERGGNTFLVRMEVTA
jgi:DNA-binding response OmpR family regulator